MWNAYNFTPFFIAYSKSVAFEFTLFIRQHPVIHLVFYKGDVMPDWINPWGISLFIRHINNDQRVSVLLPSLIV